MKTNDAAPRDAGNQNRRGFLKTGAASIAAGLSGGVIAASASGEVTSTLVKTEVPLLHLRSPVRSAK
jgi:hypothetical protein